MSDFGISVTGLTDLQTAVMTISHNNEKSLFLI